MSSAKKTVSIIASRIMAMQAGFKKDFTARSTVNVKGGPMGQPAILSQLGTYLTIVTDVDNARTTLSVKVAAKKDAEPDILSFLSELETAVKYTFGKGDPRLVDFGLKLPKARKQLSSEEKAVAAASARGTKKARGIMGKNERAAITTQGKPGLALVDAQGNVVPGAVKGPTPPGSGTPVDVTDLAGGPQAPAVPEPPAGSNGNTPSGK